MELSVEIFILVTLADVYLSCEAAVPALNDRNKMSAFTSPLMFTERRIGHSRAELLSSVFIIIPGPSHSSPSVSCSLISVISS